MKKRLCFIVTIIMLFGSTKIVAQVKIGDNPNTVNSGSLLELESTNKGLLLPRLADTTSITNPSQGMFMFNNNDTSLYFRRLGGWQRLSVGEDSYWHGINDQNQKLFQIYNTTPISLVGNWPGIFFNSYGNYSSCCMSMAPGYSGNISFDPNAGNYYFSFQEKAGLPNTIVNQFTKMYLSKDGQLGLNTGISKRAWMEEQGAINNACAIFGGEGSGVAIEEHWPSIGFNSYYNYDGTGYHSIGAGFGGETGIDQNNGDFYVTNFTGKVNSNDIPFSAGVRSFNINPNGFIGINTMNPNAEIEINQPHHNIPNVQNLLIPSDGLMFTTHEVEGANQQYTSSFSISGWTGPNNGNFGAPFLIFNNVGINNQGLFQEVANIDVFGAYHQISDARFKKDIALLDESSMLQKLLLLKPSNYHFINEKTTMPKSYGFLAQDVEKIFPEFVDEIQGKKMLAYSSFVPVIVAAMQEQQLEIETLKKQNHVSPNSIQDENSDLKNQVATLTEMVKQLQQRVNALEKRVK